MKLQYRSGSLAFCITCAALLTLLIMPLAASAATLANRYSFNETSGTTVSDSVGGQTGTLQGNAALNGTGQVTLDGANGSYVSLPGGLVSSLSAVTFEGWAYNASSPDNVCLFSFDDGVGQGQYGNGTGYIRYVIHDQSNARSQFEQASQSGNSELFAYPGLGDQSVHVVCVYDTVRKIQSVYTNGVLMSVFQGALQPLSLVGTNAGAIGRSPWWNWGDPWMSGTVDEIRIWNGALNPLQIAASDVAGPGTVSTNYGTVTSIQLQVAFQMAQNSSQQAVVLASATGIPTSPNIWSIANYTAGDTSVLTVNSNGVITAVGAGSTTITASYGGKSDTQSITVIPPVATLTHRWSFNEPTGSLTVTDAVGGAVGTLMGSAAVGSGQVTLDGSGGTYVSLPGGLLSGLQSVAFEAWVTNAADPDNTCLFEFGDELGAGGNFLRYVLHDSNGTSGATPNARNFFQINASASSTVSGYPGLGGQTVHVVCLYDPSSGVQAVFTNGALESVITGASLPALSNLSTNGGSLGQSPWAGSDPYLAGSIDEFRILSGTITPQRIAMDYAAGPGTYSTNNEGALQSIALQVSPTMPSFGAQTAGLLVTYARLTNFNIVANSIIPVAGLTITSGNTNVVTVGPNNVLNAGTPGTATITAVYQGKTNSTLVTVVSTPPASLVHRWNFNETIGTTAVDSIGGQDGTLTGAAAFNGSGQVVLDGSSGTFVNLPGGLVSSLSAVTFEAWVNIGTNSSAVTLFGFGSATSGQNYIRYQPRINAWYNDQNLFEISTTSGTSGLSVGPRLINQAVHVVCVYDPSVGLQAIYTNGVLEASALGVTIPLNTVGTDVGYLGQPVIASETGYLNGSIDEFRIYSGRLTPPEIAAAQIVGPDVLLTTNVSLSASVSGGNIVVSWPVAAAGFTLKSSPSLGAGAVWSDSGLPSIVGASNK